MSLSLATTYFGLPAGAWVVCAIPHPDIAADKPTAGAFSVKDLIVVLATTLVVVVVHRHEPERVLTWSGAVLGDLCRVCIQHTSSSVTDAAWTHSRKQEAADS
jgi:hypothetical protein